MVNIQSKLKDPNAEFKTSIQCVFYYNSKRFVYSLGDDKTIIPELWDDSNMRALNAKSMSSKDLKELLKQYSSDNYNVENELININQRIDNVLAEITKFISNKEIQNQPLILGELKSHLHSTFNCNINLPKQIEVKPITLNEYIENFIKGLYIGDITFTTSGGERKQYRKSSAKVYKEFKTQFDLYQTIIKRNLNFNHIDREFYDAFLKYFSDKDYLTNSIGKQVKCLKAVLSRAYEENIHTNDSFRQKWFKTLTSEADNVYLTQAELDMIHDLDLTSTPHLDKARGLILDRLLHNVKGFRF
ncbi:MAG: phage integrase SAM-like domain-containing protein [Saprospiraceae bacterium]|nr:phage integrase SAM-like domain-containing protein [Saprospiraceae bacterium]